MSLSLCKPPTMLVTLVICLSVLPGCGSSDTAADLSVEQQKQTPAVAKQADEPEIELPLLGGVESAPVDRTFAETIDALQGNNRCSDDEVRELIDHIEQAPSDPLVIDAAQLVFRSGRMDDVQAVGEAIVDHHLDNPQVIKLAQKCYEARGGVNVLSQITQKATGDLRATASYWLALKLNDSPKAIELMRDVAKHDTDLPIGESTMQTLANGFINARLNLQVGKTALEIDGEDVHGDAFKLSDYRGKVVVLDFWGDW